MGNVLVQIIKAISLKKCHSSCCDIEIEARSPPQSPRKNSVENPQTFEELKIKKKDELLNDIYGLPT